MGKKGERTYKKYEDGKKGGRGHIKRMKDREERAVYDKSMV